VDLQLRGIERHEVAAAVALIEESTLTPGVEDPSRLDEYWEAVLETRRHRGEVLVALVDTEVVGMCHVIVFQHFQHSAGWCCELETVYVRSDLRSRGIGGAMLAWAEDFARARGCYRVQLASRNPRLEAHRFYRERGYEQNSQGFKKLLVDEDLAQVPVVDVEDEAAHLGGVDEGAGS
jgi:GNAT superfamily N-acetyltransferase